MRRIPPLAIIAAGCLIALVGFGVRSSFGLFLEPMTVDRGWGRETFAIALAIQNLVWGLGVPFASMAADRFGPSRVLGIGALIYAAGTWGFSIAEAPLELHLLAGVLIGLGIAFTSFSIALAVMAKAVSEKRRSLVLGIGTACGSLGQVVFSPLSQGFISAYGWQSSLVILAAITVLMLPLALLLSGDADSTGQDLEDQGLVQAIVEAARHRGYVLLTAGFFVCGFHVAFITVHFPSYVRDLGLDAAVGANAIAMIGMFNILGAFLSGIAGQRVTKKTGLAFIYFARAIVILALLLADKTATTVYWFAAGMGILWLSTVPLTSGIVAQVFGLRYMATLFGIVFLSHQLGSFSGVWLGGFLFDRTGSYDLVWQVGVGLSVIAALLHLPIDERPLARLSPQRGKV